MEHLKQFYTQKLKGLLKMLVDEEDGLRMIASSIVVAVSVDRCAEEWMVFPFMAVMRKGPDNKAWSLALFFKKDRCIFLTDQTDVCEELSAVPGTVCVELFEFAVSFVQKLFHVLGLHNMLCFGGYCSNHH